MKAKIIAATPENVADFGMCGYKNPKNEGYAKKIEFVRSRLGKGLVYKFLVSESGEPVGGIEYMPGELVADRPISKTRFANIAKKKLSPKKKT